MKNYFLDAVKGIAKLVGMVLYVIGYPFYKSGYWLLNLKSSRDIILEKAIEQAERKAKGGSRRATTRKNTDK